MGAQLSGAQLSGGQLSATLAVGGTKSKSILQYFLHFGVLYETLKYFSVLCGT